MIALLQVYLLVEVVKQLRETNRGLDISGALRALALRPLLPLASEELLT